LSIRAVSICCLFLFSGLHCFAIDRAAFTFVNYNLDIRIEPDQQRLAARGTIELRNDSSSPQKNISLQISSSLHWSSILFAGQPVQVVFQPYISDIDHTGSLSEAIVSLPRALEPRSLLELEIGYEGTIPRDATRLTRLGVAEDEAGHTDWDRIDNSFTGVRGAGHVVWYPVAMEAASLTDPNGLFEMLGQWQAREARAKMKLNFTYAGSANAHRSLLCNGTADRSTADASGAETMTCSFASLETEIPAFVIGDYQTLDRPPVVVHYALIHQFTAQKYAAAVQKVAPFVAGWFGGTHGTVQVADLPDEDAAAYENGGLLLTSLEDVSATQAEIVAVHQLTHAAFPSPRQWIFEGLAHFAQALYAESQNGRKAALESMEPHRVAMIEAEKQLASQRGGQEGRNSSGGRSISTALVNTSVEEFYRSKAMYVWWMLRDMVGDAALKKTLAAYHPESDKEPTYLQHLVEAQAKRDLQWFFDDWVYHDRGLPDFRVYSVYPYQTPQNTTMVTVMVENLGSAGAEVPVTVRSAGEDVTRRIQVRGNSKNSIRIELASAPTEVVVNDGSVPESDMGNNRFEVESGKR